MSYSPRHLLLLILISILIFPGCWSFYKDRNHGTYSEIRPEAYVPIYGVDSNYFKITSIEPQPIVQSGKIYVLGSYLFQVENFKGVHIINYGDRRNPVKIGFIKSSGATEVAVKNGYLIVNNGLDLVTVDISDPMHAKEAARVKNAFKTFYWDQSNYTKPPEKGKYFVCPLYEPGVEITGWKMEKNVENAYCYNY